MARHAARSAEPKDEKPSRAALSAARTVLVVTSDSAGGGEMVGALQRHRFPSLQAATPAQALFWARREPPALVVLDLGLEGWRSLLPELLRDQVAVLALGDDSRTRTQALESGCLDASPWGSDPEELTGKVAALLRRSLGSIPTRVAAGPLVADLPAQRLFWRGEEIPVPLLLLRLAAYLGARPGRIIPSRVLLAEVWREPWAQDLGRVHQAMWRLRRLLGEPADSPLLVGRQGRGYGLFPRPAPVRPRRRASGF